MRATRARSLGGVIGIVVAVAGGFGAAVGFYSLPDPQGLTVEAGVYARPDQRAIAVWKNDGCNEISCTILSIDAGRGGSEGHDLEFGLSDGFPRATGNQDLNVFFAARLTTCTEEGCNETGIWQAPSVPSAWFTFDPLMGGASFSGDVAGCQFDVAWTADGLIAPFAGFPQASTSLGAWHAGADLGSGFAEVSRVAPASIQMAAAPIDGSCDVTAIPQANGFLSQGIRRTLTDGSAAFQ